MSWGSGREKKTYMGYATYHAAHDCGTLLMSCLEQGYGGDCRCSECHQKKPYTAICCEETFHDESLTTSKHPGHQSWCEYYQADPVITPKYVGYANYHHEHGCGIMPRSYLEEGRGGNCRCSICAHKKPFTACCCGHSFHDESLVDLKHPGHSNWCEYYQADPVPKEDEESSSSSSSSSSSTDTTTTTTTTRTLERPLPKHSFGVTGSWRDTIFVWCGMMEVPEDGRPKHTFTWTGAWVGVDSKTSDGPKYPVTSGTCGIVHRRSHDPVVGPRGEYSLNTFSVSGNRNPEHLESVCFEKTEYLLDNGDGLETHIDPAYSLCVKVGNYGIAMVTAAGANEFGAFISVGLFFPAHIEGKLGGQTGKLVLARRYVEEGDCRSFMNCTDVMEELGNKAMYDLNGHRYYEPWNDKICRCSFYEASKEQKAMFKERKRRGTKRARVRK